MASVTETTAVAFRRGTKAQNDGFTGIEGEITVDLGEDNNGLVGVDPNVTLRVHNGITQGGIPLCRKDMQNMTTEVLAKNRNLIGDKNLAYADLSNLLILDDSARRNVVNELKGCGIYNDVYWNEKLNTKVDTNLENLNVGILASGKGADNLAYANTRNINTRYLTDGDIHSGTDGNKPLSYADGSNIDTTDLANVSRSSELGGALAKVDLSNVSDETWNTILKGDYTLESQKNRVFEIKNGGTNDTYPTSRAVADFVRERESEGGMKSNFSNCETWEPLTSNSKSFYGYETSTVVNRGSHFEEEVDYSTNVFLTNDAPKLVKVVVTDIDANGKILYDPSNGIYGVEFNDFAEHNHSGIRVLHIKSETGVVASIQYGVVYNEEFDMYCFEITNVECPNDAGFELKEYENTDGFTQSVCLKVVANKVVDGELLEVSYEPSKGYTDINNENIKIFNSYEEESAEDPEETVIVDCSAVVIGSVENLFPQMGGAGLLKNNMTNLGGMNEKDVEVEEHSNWRIRHDLPLNTTGTSSEDDYFRIVTAGLVQDVLNKILNGDISGALTSQTTDLTEHSTKVATTSYVWDLILKKMTPDYAGQVINSGATSYTTPSDGWVFVRTYTNDRQTATFSISGKEVWRHYSRGDSNGIAGNNWSGGDVAVSGLYFVRQGTVCTASYTTDDSINCIGFYPML